MWGEQLQLQVRVNFIIHVGRRRREPTNISHQIYCYAIFAIGRGGTCVSDERSCSGISDLHTF